jgi:uncharacterized membrane protein
MLHLRHPAHNRDADLLERVARSFGTRGYLAAQTVLVLAWIAVNACMVALRWDPYPFILLNLAFSTQAAYAAPLILLVQNRQDTADREAAGIDHSHNTENLHLTRAIHRHLIGGDEGDDISA